ncbi:MAG: hypothetical protein L3J12_06745, partial [Spirochaetales bacterium]|nr:hypothetical protein [Spirochaetales bacterium]
MKGLKSAVLILLIILTITVSGFTLDFGGNLEDSTYYTYSGSSGFYHADALSLWFTSKLWRDTDLYIRGSYTYTTDNPMFFNLDSAMVVNKGSSILNYSFGRIHASDFSGYILNHTIDGVSVGINLPFASITTKVGYTGFVFDSASNIGMTTADQTGISYAGITQDFGSPRIVAGAEALFPDLFMNQDFKIGVWSQFDMRPDSDVQKAGDTVTSITSGKMDTQYFGMAYSFPILQNLFYDGFAWIGTGQTLSATGSTYTDELILSFLGSAGLKYYPGDSNFSKFSFRFLYTTGDADYSDSFTEGNTSGDAGNFTPITKKSPAMVFSPTLGNIMFTELSYSIKPFSRSGNKVLKNIQTELRNITFLRTTTGKISESGIDSASDNLYLGTEIDGTVNFRPFSDLGISLSG